MTELADRDQSYITQLYAKIVSAIASGDYYQVLLDSDDMELLEISVKFI